MGLGSKNLDPTSGYGCHMAKSTGEDSRRRSRVDLYRQQLVLILIERLNFFLILDIYV